MTAGGRRGERWGVWEWWTVKTLYRLQWSVWQCMKFDSHTVTQVTGRMERLSCFMRDKHRERKHGCSYEQAGNTWPGGSCHWSAIMKNQNIVHVFFLLLLLLLLLFYIYSWTLLHNKIKIEIKYSLLTCKIIYNSISKPVRHSMLQNCSHDLMSVLLFSTI